MKKFIFSLLALSLIGSFVFATPASAQRQTPDQDVIIQNLEGQPGVSDNFGLPNNSADDSRVRNILQTVFLAAGGLGAIFIAVGGLRYVLSDGNDQKIQQAVQTFQQQHTTLST